MKDSLDREIDYMRISITDRCNLRCQYCMPNGIECVPMEQILTYEEICSVVTAAAGLGIRHIKVTGGEPLVRKGCPALIGMLKEISGIEKVTITTNGILLKEQLDDLIAAGSDGINVSLDTMDRERFAGITGFDGLEQVLHGIFAAVERGIRVKLNVVSLDFTQKEAAAGRTEKADKSAQSGISEDWMRLIDLTREKPIDVRFIEMMPIGYGRSFPAIGHERLLAALQVLYPGLEPARGNHGFGPAVYYHIPGYIGDIGLISAIHGKFCDNCNRVRLTAKGFLKTCLCYEDGVDLQPILRADISETERQRQLNNCMRRAITAKPDAHCFEHPDRITEREDMVSIGG